MKHELKLFYEDLNFLLQFFLVFFPNSAIYFQPSFSETVDDSPRLGLPVLRASAAGEESDEGSVYNSFIAC